MYSYFASPLGTLNYIWTSLGKSELQEPHLKLKNPIDVVIDSSLTRELSLHGPHDKLANGRSEGHFAEGFE